MLRTIATSPSFIYEVLILEVNNYKQGCLQHPHTARPASDAPDTSTLASGAAMSELSRDARYCATSMNNRSIQAKKIISPCLTIKKGKKKKLQYALLQQWQKTSNTLPPCPSGASVPMGCSLGGPSLDRVLGAHSYRGGRTAQGQPAPEQ